MLDKKPAKAEAEYKINCYCDAMKLQLLEMCNLVQKAKLDSKLIASILEAHDAVISIRLNNSIGD